MTYQYLVCQSELLGIICLLWWCGLL